MVDGTHVVLLVGTLLLQLYSFGAGLSDVNCYETYGSQPCFLLLLLSGDVETNPGPGLSSSGQCPPNLSYVLLNARSIANKLLDLHALLGVQKPDLVFITETFLDSTILDSEIVDDDSIVFRSD